MEPASNSRLAPTSSTSTARKPPSGEAPGSEGALRPSRGRFAFRRGRIAPAEPAPEERACYVRLVGEFASSRASHLEIAARIGALDRRDHEELAALLAHPASRHLYLPCPALEGFLDEARLAVGRWAASA